MTEFDGARLREWRKSNHYSQEELARELEVTRQTVIGWEQSEKVSRIVQLALAALENTPVVGKIGARPAAAGKSTNTTASATSSLKS